MRLASHLGLALLAVLALGGAFALNHTSSDSRESVESKTLAFEGSRAETVRFMNSHRSIHLTPAQEAIKEEALAAIPAPCCSNFSAATCCCECNLARTIWGLSELAIAREGLGVAEVRAVVGDWVQSINPSGYPGDTCFKGGCGRPFKEGGCGGMHKERVSY